MPYVLVICMLMFQSQLVSKLQFKLGLDAKGPGDSLGEEIHVSTCICCNYNLQFIWKKKIEI